MTLRQINKLIAESGLMQKHIALKLDVSREHLNRVLKGKLPMTGHIAHNLEVLLRPARD